MKLRQKLAMVLAAAMVVTAVPVTTMAKSTNNLNKTVSIVEGTEIVTEDALYLDIKINERDAANATTEKDRTFVIVATDFDFAKDMYNNDAFEAGNKLQGVTVVNATKSEIVVKLDATTRAVAKEVRIPIHGKVKKGTPKITVNSLDSVVSASEFAIGGEVTSDKKLAATAADPTNISIDGVGKLADIKIEEKEAGALAGQTITVELDRKSDLVFRQVSAEDITVDGGLGLAGKGAADLVAAVNYGTATEDADGTVKYAGYDDDAQIMHITFKDLESTARGYVTLKGLGVKAEDPRNGADTGKVEVEVSGKTVGTTDLHVADVKEFGLELKAKEEIELVAGKEAKKVKIQFNELAAGTINDNRDVFFTIEGATVTDFEDKTFDDGSVLTYDKDDKEFHLTFGAKFDEKSISKYEFEVEMYAKAAYEGDITVTATSRDFEDMQAVIGSVEAAVVVKSDDVVIKVGQNGQEVEGEIVLSEVEAETFERNEVVVVKLDEEATDDGIKIKDATVEVTEGDLEIKDITVENGEIRFTVKRESDEASTITINEFVLDSNRTTPEGKYNVVIGGDAISDRNLAEDDEDTKDEERVLDTFKVENFVVVGTKNTEDIQDAAKAKEVILAIDSKDYTVDGEAKVGAAAPYIEAGRTMIPTRLVAEEFGAIVDFNTLNGVGTVTIQKEGTTIQFQNGSNVLNKNGIQIPMDAKTVIKDGVTYVPFRYLATALNITDFKYDAPTNTVTFKN